MPLTSFQGAVARLLATQRTADSYLAGGAALHIAPNSLRYSNALDYFQDSGERVATAFTADQQVLTGAGYLVNVSLDRPGFVRAIVSKNEHSTKVEWVHDSAWRFMPTVQDDIAGFMLHPVDLAINKLLALVGREEPRDFLDTLYADRHILELGALLWAAVGKDPGFSPSMLLGLLRRRGAYRPEDFARLMLREQPELTSLKQRWLDALSAADEFIERCPSSELGCLYYSLSQQRFVGKFELGDKDVLPHYGRPGGVLPQIRE